MRQVLYYTVLYCIEVVRKVSVLYAGLGWAGLSWAACCPRIESQPICDSTIRIYPTAIPNIAYVPCRMNKPVLTHPGGVALQQESQLKNHSSSREQDTISAWSWGRTLC